MRPLSLQVRDSLIKEVRFSDGDRRTKGCRSSQPAGTIIIVLLLLLVSISLILLVLLLSFISLILLVLLL